MSKFNISILLNIISISLLAQPNEIKIWPQGVPGAKIYPGYVERRTGNANSPRIERISDPSLISYILPVHKIGCAAVLICPGGGYGDLAISYEGHEVAKWFNQIGISAFILKYRLPHDSIMEDKSIGPLQDAQEAIRIIRRNAKVWGIDPSKIGVIGFSAGGHLASTLSTHFEEKVYPSVDSVSARPDFSVLVYPVITMDSAYTDKGTRQRLIGKTPDLNQVKRFSNELQVRKTTPLTFLVHSWDDKTVPVQNSINYFVALKNANVPSELHIFETGGHGYGLASSHKGSESSWPGLLIHWLKANKLLSDN